MWWNDYVGIPFVSCGRTLAGCDCWGLLCMVYLDVFKKEIPSYGGAYQSALDRAGTSVMICDNKSIDGWEIVEPGKEQSGDAILLNVAGFPCHVGIVTTPGHMLHISSGSGSIVESYRKPDTASRIEGIYRHA